MNLRENIRATWKAGVLMWRWCFLLQASPAKVCEIAPEANAVCQRRPATLRTFAVDGLESCNGGGGAVSTGYGVTPRQHLTGPGSPRPGVGVLDTRHPLLWKRDILHVLIPVLSADAGKTSSEGG
ncbi:hypothetical protein B0I37DRAFT_376572 [Chaetomium sp. MPI-CAGE-AT-0009]|nr:hypothetical protein B0I37DRAFT_376572 [Chaetomium sp. MPI-CAGE-AT-0009]